jgi:hypothetical protein
MPLISGMDADRYQEPVQIDPNPAIWIASPGTSIGLIRWPGWETGGSGPGHRVS